jgi:plastocyanin
MKTLRGILLAATLSLANSVTSPVQASQTWDVAVGPNGTLTFSPSTVNIAVGDTVRWTWASSGHTVTSGIYCPACVPPNGPCYADNKFCSPNDINCGSGITSNSGTVYSHTFSQPGTFPYFCAVHCSSGMLGTVNVCTPPPSGMVDWWPGNGNGYDVQGGNNVTLYNGAGFAAGMVGQAFNFQNAPNATSGQYAGNTSPVGLPVGNSARTLDLWFRTATNLSTTGQTESALFEYGAGNTADALGGHAFGLITTASAPGKLYFTGEGQDLAGTTTIQPNTWYHAAVTYDGTTVTLYLNGQVENSAARFLNTFLDANGLTIGLRPGSAVWNGQIDEVELFNRALSQAEIQAIYNAGSAGKCIPPLQLMAAGSRKTHGSVGTFDINLPFSFVGPSPFPGIECRVGGGTSGDHTLVFTFNNIPVSGSASLASGTGSASGNPTFAGHEMRVNLTGVTNAQLIGVTLNVTDSFGQSFVNPQGTPINMGVLLGDVNASGLVDGNDVSAVQSHTRQSVNSTNFRYDVNTSGSIDGNDVSATQAATRTSIP